MKRINILFIILCFCLSAVSQNNRDYEYCKEHTEKLLDEFYGLLNEYMKADDTDEQFNFRKELINITTKNEAYFLDCSPGKMKTPNLYNITTYITAYCTNLRSILRDYSRERYNIEITRSQEKCTIIEYKAQSIMVRADYNICLTNRMQDWSKDTLCYRACSAICEIPRKSKNKKITQILPVKDLMASPQKQGKKIKVEYIVKLDNKDSNKIDWSPNYTGGTYAMQYQSYKVITDNRGLRWKEQVPIAINKNSCSWVKPQVDEANNRIIFDLWRSYSKDVRYATLTLGNDYGNNVGTIHISQQPHPKYKFPSWYHNNGRDEELVGLAYIYSPNAEFGLNITYMMRGFEFGLDLAVGLNTFKISGYPTKAKSITAGDSYFEYTGDSYFSTYDPKMDPYKEAAKRSGIGRIGGILGYYFNDYLGLQLGLGYALSKDYLILKNAYNYTELELEPGKKEISYEKSDYTAYFEDRTHHGAFISLGINYLIHFNEWENGLKIGAGYRYSPTIKEVNNFYVTLGVFFY